MVVENNAIRLREIKSAIIEENIQTVSISTIDRMEKLLLITVLFASCYATQDLSGKLFVFPRLGRIDHVKLATTKTTFNAATVCFRFITDTTKGYSLFSLATPVHNNSLLLYNPRAPVIRVHVNDMVARFRALPTPPNTWHSMCTTWSSDDGLSQLLLNGKLTIKRYVASQKPITGVPIIILGQDQDSYGGGFDAKQSFIGMMSKVHMWDYVLSPTELRAYEKGENFTPGNVLNWRALDFQLAGLASVHEDPEHVVRCT
ncbi:serum amyloid P-component-like [Scomber japonicus]|uniref:serum amyloid P-component-like n=1 Tax=Scomber japonicus TaxID=13676 RepID=UPI00230513C0|nr:serum amyloid P-component-like [Scomber japonicus]